jgi:hypothetical protein
MLHDNRKDMYGEMQNAYQTGREEKRITEVAFR